MKLTTLIEVLLMTDALQKKSIAVNNLKHTFKLWLAFSHILAANIKKVLVIICKLLSFSQQLVHKILINDIGIISI